MELLNNFNLIISAVIAAGGIIVAVYRITTSNKNSTIREEIRKSFEDTIRGLYSDNITERIGSAILLRRYLNRKNREGRMSVSYKSETLNVIASLLKIEKCSEFQKTLADSLSYAYDMSYIDLQYANIQNGLIKMSVQNLEKDIPKDLSDDKVKILMREADLYMADLSYASISGVDFSSAHFNNANVTKTAFTNCDFNGADFSGAYLKDVRFKTGCKLENANFRGAWGVPDYIKVHLDKDGMYHEEVQKTEYGNDPVEVRKKKVFISCAGTLTPKQSEFMDKLKYDLERFGVEFKRFDKNKYRSSGQLSAIQTEISSCNGLIALGFTELHIKEGTYRVGTNDKQDVSGQFLTSPWVTLETGIAYSLGKHILILYDERLRQDCILDSEITDRNLSRICVNSTNYDDYEEAILQWIQSLE